MTVRQLPDPALCTPTLAALPPVLCPDRPLHVNSSLPGDLALLTLCSLQVVVFLSLHIHVSFVLRHFLVQFS